MLNGHRAHRFLILIALLWLSLSRLTAAQAAPAAPSPFAGHWEGAIQTPGGELQVMVDLTPGEAGGKGRSTFRSRAPRGCLSKRSRWTGATRGSPSQEFLATRRSTVK